MFPFSADIWWLVVPALPVVALLLGVFNGRATPSGPVGVLRGLLRAYLLVGAPLLFLALFDTGGELDCCSDAVFFAPGHRQGVYALTGFVWLAYAYSSRRQRAGPPLLELLANVTLVGGLVFTAAVFVHAASLGHAPTAQEVGLVTAMLGCAPIFALLCLRLAQNARRNADSAHARDATGLTRAAWRIISAPLGLRFSLFVLLLAPFLALISGVLMLFGQQPDSLVRAFTETHHHGLSALREQCLDVQCRGHYLCTVAVLGHPWCVKPLGYGSRNGQAIICNRQLLVANAFEELIREKSPWTHARLRRTYDRVGARLQRHYHHFENPWLCDVVYWSMKPLELTFLLVLNLCDSEPEHRIQRQYCFRVLRGLRHS